MPEFDDVVHGFEILNMEFSKITLAELYVVQEVAAIEVRLKENAVSYQETKQIRNATMRKTLLREKEQKIEAREQSRLALAESIKGAVVEFPLEAGQEDEDSVTRVGHLSKIMVELKKKVEELQEKKVLSTPREVLEE